MDFFNPLVFEWQSLLTTEVNLYIILFKLLIAVLFIQLLYYWVIFIRIASYNMNDSGRSSEFYNPVSVIIAARDEYYNLRKNLPAILQQHYPDFEVIVVNNDSTDESGTLLREFQSQYSNLKVINLERNLNFFKGKKFPLAIGIQAAKNDILLFTDADCKPASSRWIYHMQKSFSPNTGIVLGIGQYSSRSGLLNLIIRFDAFFVTLQYLSYALAGMPYMGVGRNLAYRKSLFNKEKGFISHYNISSGDDDLFVNKASKSTNTQIQIIPESHTFTRSPGSLRKYFIQKRRHFTTAKYYRAKHKFVLGLYSFTQLLFYALMIFFLTAQKFLLLACIGFALRWISQIIIFHLAGNKLHFKNLFLLSPLIEFVVLLFHIVVILSNRISKPKRWK